MMTHKRRLDDGLCSKRTTPKEFNKEELFKLVKNSKIPIIILGSLFSDVNFMKEVIKENGGFFIYNRTILDIKNDSSKLIDILKNTNVLQIKKDILKDCKSISIKINNKEIEYEL